MERQTFTLGPLGGLKSKKPVICSVCQTDKGTFFSTGNDVHACRKVGHISVFFETGRILAVSILQNSSDPTPPFFERIPGSPEKGAVRRVPVTVFWGSSGNIPFLTSEKPEGFFSSSWCHHVSDVGENQPGHIRYPYPIRPRTEPGCTTFPSPPGNLMQKSLQFYTLFQKSHFTQDLSQSEHFALRCKTLMYAYGRQNTRGVGG